jgi:hypothetical protein
MTVTLKGFDEHQQQRLQPLAAHPIGRFPQNDERLAHGLVVETQTPPSAWDHRRCSRAQDANRVFPVVPCDGNELVEDPSFLISGGSAIPFPDRVDQLPSRFPIYRRRHFRLHSSAR